MQDRSNILCETQAKHLEHESQTTAPITFPRIQPYLGHLLKDFLFHMGFNKCVGPTLSV